VYVAIDLREFPPVVALEEPDDCTRLHLAVVGTVPSLDADGYRLVYAALIDAAAGSLEDGHGRLAIDALRRLARGRVADGWDDRFDAMLGDARTRGWIDPDQTSLQAHLEYTGG